jgi:predicted N-formylglutamate amidohydrolase
MLTDNFGVNNPFHMCATALEDSRLLDPDEGRAVEVLNGTGKAAMVVVCEHAARRLPRALGDMGLSDAARESHIAWDPGALAVARQVAATFDAPLVAARFSRLVYDCNRPPERADAMPERSEVFEIPGNRELSPSARMARIREIAEPFATTLAEVVEERIAAVAPPALVTIHSFTPVWFGERREVELGLLHDADSRLVDAMLPEATRLTGLRAARNEPYGPADGVTHTLAAHALPRGLPNVMVEIRNDLIATPEDVTRVAEGLSALIRHGLDRLDWGAA